MKKNQCMSNAKDGHRLRITLIVAILLPALLGTSIEPKHNWAFDIGESSFGISQWGESDCEIYFGTQIAQLNVSASTFLFGVAVVLGVLITLCFCRSFWNLRDQKKKEV